jgi:hypothetical protein
MAFPMSARGSGEAPLRLAFLVGSGAEPQGVWPSGGELSSYSGVWGIALAAVKICSILGYIISLCSLTKQKCLGDV